MSGFPQPATRERIDILSASEGLKGQGPFVRTANAQILTTQIMQAQVLPIRPGELISNLAVEVTTLGGAITLLRLGLYDYLGNLLGSTADVKADFATTGLKVEPLSSAVTWSLSQPPYAAILATGAGLPTLTRGANLAGASDPGAGGTRSFWQHNAAVNDLPNPAVIAQSGLQVWFGWS